MGKLIERARRHDDGFTLIELLIVIVILGILAAIVVFSISGITDKGTKSACKADKETVTVAGEAYFAQNGAYSTDIATLVPSFLHADSSIAGATMTKTGYVITYGGGGGLNPFTVTSNFAGC